MKNNKRHLDSSFLELFKPKGKFYDITVLAQEDPYLNFEMRGNSVEIYYRGGRLLSINNLGELNGLDPQYSLSSIPQPDLHKIQEYISNAKHIIDRYVSTVKNHLGEKEIQQRVVYENNLSVNAQDTDYFIVDTEWQNASLGGRADIMAFRWLRPSPRRRINEVQLTMIEVKQGTKSFKGKAGLQKHITDYELISKNSEYMQMVAEDMLDILIQKHELGLIKGLDKYLKNDSKPRINQDVEFVFLLANYHPYSKILDQIVHSLPINSKFYISSFMGYGLYHDFIKTKDEMISMFPSVFN